MKILIAVIVFSLIVLFHEFGHFIVAKKCNVKVNEFMLGLGPRIFGIQRGETMYSLHLLPFGGACVMEGEDEASEDDRAFTNKPLWQRFLIVFAGPFFNFLMAYILAVILLGAEGFVAPVVTEVTEGSPADEAGIEAGDTIKALDHYHVHFYQEISLYSFFHHNKEMTITLDRDGEKITTSLIPKYDEETGRYLIGVGNMTERVKGGVLTTLKYGFYELKYQIYVVLQSLKMLVTGQVGVKDMSGPVGIVKVIGDTYESSVVDGIYYVVLNMMSFMILLSANLGVMNLLPLPALDGGRICMFIYEGIRGKRLDPDLEGKINLVGFALLMVLMVMVMFSDISKLLG